MAIQVIRLNSSPVNVAAALEASGLFARVQQSGSIWPVECYDENNVNVLTVRFQNSGYKYRFIFYYSNGGSNTELVTCYNSFDVAYCTPHGIMIKCTKDSTPCALIFTKDNNDILTCIFSKTTSPDEYVAIRRSYSGSLTSQTYTAIAGSQTALVPFVTLINDGDGRSFTPGAFWIPISENYNLGFCAITINGIQYVTNGHYALKDAEIVL